MTQRVRNGRGAIAVEVLVAVGVFAVAALPLLGVSQSQRRHAGFTSFHQQAQLLARAALAWGATRDLRALAAESGAVAAALPAGQEDAGLKSVLPANVLAALVRQTWDARTPGAKDGVDGPAAAPPAGRDALFLADLFLARTPTAGLFRLRARVTWSFPGDRADRVHTYRLERMVAEVGAAQEVLPAWPSR